MIKKDTLLVNETSSTKVAEIAPPLYHNFPEELKALNSWIHFRREWDAEAGKWKKPPCNAEGITTSFKTVSSFETVKSNQEKHSDYLAGVGYSFVNPNETIIGLDFDHVVDLETGAILPEVEELLKELNSYTEYSISGDGLHVLVDGEGFAFKGGGNKKKYRKAFGEGTELEIFVAGCYLTMSGKRLDIYGSGVRKKTKTLLGKIVKKYEAQAYANKIRKVSSKTTHEEYAEVSTFKTYFEKNTNLSICKVEPKDGVYRLHLDRCPWGDASDNPDGIGHGGDDHAMVFFEEGKEPGFFCFHNTCADNHWRELCALYPDLAVQDDYIDEFNKEYAIIETGCEVKVIRTNKDDDVMRTAKVPRVWFEAQADKIKMIQKPNGEFKEVNLAKEWFKSPRAKRYPKGFTLAPLDVVDEKKYNLWTGLDMKPEEGGSWKLFKNHWLETVCGGDKAVFDWFFMWVADMFQNPISNPYSAVIMKGEQGMGKSIIGDVIGHMLGGDEHSTEVEDMSDMFGRFNLHLARCILINAAEITFHGNKPNHNKLKGVVTKKKSAIEGKFRDTVFLPNVNRFLMSTNAKQSIPAERTERRFLVLNVPSSKNKEQMFADLMLELEQDKDSGYKALLFDLMQVKVCKVKLRHPLKTSELLHEKLLAMEPLEAFLDELLDEGLLDSEYDDKGKHIDPGEEVSNRVWSEVVSREELYEKYDAFFNQGKFDTRGHFVKSKFFKMLYRVSENHELGIKPFTKNNSDKRIRIGEHTQLKEKWDQSWLN